MQKKPKPVVLAILDGWGHSDDPAHNAVHQAHTPTLDYLFTTYPHGMLNASELHVGLPHGQMGNSEVGHMNIGSGRVVMQDLPRIDAAIADGSLLKNSALRSTIAALKGSGGVCHVMGLASPGGVHSHQDHIAFLANTIAEAGVPVVIHAFLDGRDTPPQSAKEYIATLENAVQGKASIATVSGRYYAMDRDNRWDRVALAYHAMVEAKGEKAANAQAAIDTSYAAGKNDEFLLPCVLGTYAGMKDGDALIIANFRADRAREILTALLDTGFSQFSRTRTVRFAAALGMVEYSTALNPLLATLFPPERLTNILGEIVASAGLKQLRIAETEKYAHVTFFFNGGREKEFDGETRILIPSPNVATYDMKPEMSAYEVTEKLVEVITSNHYDLIVVNYANTDMVGHTGDLNATIKAVEAVDSCLGSVYKALEKTGGAMVITADHGNAEMMLDEMTAQPHTAHTLNLVPVILAVPSLKGHHDTIAEGKLADIAPTLLALLNLQPPPEMTGRSLLPHA